MTTGLLVFAGAAQASTIVADVTTDPAGAGSCPASPCSLRQAIASAGSGDTIQLVGGAPPASAVYTLTQGSQIAVSQSLTINGAGRDASIIDGAGNLDNSNNLNRLFKVTGGTVTISNLTLRNGRDSNDEFGHSGSTINFSGGGALFVAGGTASLDHVLLDSNIAPTGGAISTNTALTMNAVSFLHNGGSLGGALFVRSGTVSGTVVTFESNGGGSFAGGAALLWGGTTTLTNATTYGNGWASARGGGITNHAGSLTLLSSTLSNDLRGSLETDAGTGASTTVENTIIGAGFSDGGIDYACITSGTPNGNIGATAGPPITVDHGNNIDEDGHCGLSTVGTGDQVGVSAKLVPIGDNGGPVRTQALLAGSAAFDAGNNTDCPLTDARGTVRQNGTCEVGAFEAIRSGPPGVVTNVSPSVNPYDATLAATINLVGEAGGYHFIWGNAAGNLTNTTEEVAAGVVSSDTPVTYLLTGLTPGQTVFYKAVADNATASTTATAVRSFTTPPGPPIVQSVYSDVVTDTTAHVNFNIDPAGAATSYVIKYGPTIGYGQTTTPVDIGSTPGGQSLSATLTGLTPNSHYHYDVVATNSQAPPGGVDGGDQEFSTVQQVTGTTAAPVTLTDSGDFGFCPTVSINWGDSTPSSAGTVTCHDNGNGGQAYDMTAHHTYATAGHRKIVMNYQGNPVEAWALITTAPQRALSVALDGTGTGSVAGAGIACPGECSKNFTNGSAATLTATPADGSTFSGWSGACTGTGDCQLTMDSDRSVTATFTSNPAPGPTPPAGGETPPVQTPPATTAPLPLPLSCAGVSILLLGAHVEGGKVVVDGLALPKDAGRSVTITPSSKKAPGGTATVQKDGTFQAKLAPPAKSLRGTVRYVATIDASHSAAVKLTRRLLITSEKPVAGGLRVAGVLSGGKKGSSIIVTRQRSCTSREAFKKVKAGKGGAFSVVLPRPSGSDLLAFYRLDASLGKGKADSLPVVVRVA